MKNGVAPEEIICKDNLDLIFKESALFPSCVKPSTAEKLFERGWAKNTEKNVDSHIIKYSPVLFKGTGVDLKDEKLIELLEHKREQFDLAFDELGVKGLYPIVGESFSIGQNAYSLNEKYLGKPIALDIHVLKEEFTKTTLEEVDELVRKYVGDEIDIVYSKGGYVIPTSKSSEEKSLELYSSNNLYSNSTISTNRIIQNNLEYTGGTFPPIQCPGNYPIFTSIDTPEQILIGETFDVIISWSWVIFDEDEKDSIDRIVTEIDPNCGVGQIYLQFPEELSLLTEVSNKKINTDWRDHQRFTVTESLEFDNTKINSKTFQFRLTDEIHFPDDKLTFGVGTFIPDLFLTSISESVSQFSTVRIETTDSTIAKEYRESVPHSQGIILENYTSVPNMDNFAQYLKKYIDVENMTQFLLDQNLSEEYIKEFFQKYPE